jgi:uncharacterized protein YndB with AHSA1/START domain
MTSQAVEVEPIRHTVVVRCSVGEAFRLFTDDIATWWPFKTHSYGGEDVETAIFEGRAGGRLYERQRDGTEREWGEVLAWDPPNRFVLAWKICEPTEVEVRMTAEGDATRVELEHRGWENVDPERAAQYGGYAAGWGAVLAHFEKSIGV